MDLIGQKFGRLIVIKKMANNKHRQSMWLCRCDCGKEKIICGGDLKNGHTRSCGCFNREKITKHGHYQNNKKSQIYSSWDSMIGRCTNPNDRDYRNYGGRGITVCERWRKFVNFLKDMGEHPTDKHSIDRIDNDKGYCQSNCRWALPKEQARNRRTNRLISHGGRTLCLIEWAEECNIRYRTLHHRIFTLKWSIEKALTTPVKSQLST